jgi:hypothetical protein
LTRLKQDNSGRHTVYAEIAASWPFHVVDVDCACQIVIEPTDHATQWLWTYNNDRPNMGVGGITPAQKLKLQTAA